MIALQVWDDYRKIWYESEITANDEKDFKSLLQWGKQNGLKIRRKA